MCKMAVEIEDKKKLEFEKVLQKRGFSVQEAIETYVNAVIKNDRIPWFVAMEDTYGPYDTVEECRKACHELQSR